MKTRLSEKTKSRLRKEQITRGALKRKTCHPSSEIKRGGILDLCRKDEPSNDTSKTSLPIGSKTRNQPCNDSIALSENGKKLMMLRCINREEAIEGKDFIFTIHYIDSADNFVFDSVLMQKQLVDNEKHHTSTNSKYIGKAKQNALKNNDENFSIDLFKTQKLEKSSKTADNMVRDGSSDLRNSDEKTKNEMNTKYAKKTRSKLSPFKNKEVMLSSNSENTVMVCKSVSEDLEVNKLSVDSISSITEMNDMRKSPSIIEFSQEQRENGDIVMKDMEKHSLPNQNVQMITDDIVENKMEYCVTLQKNLKRNLNKEFTDAACQSKNEKRLLIEADCNDKLSSIAEPIQLQNEMNNSDSQNAKRDNVNSPQKIASPKDSILISKSCSNVHNNNKNFQLAHSIKAQVNDKGITPEIETNVKTSKKDNCSNEKTVMEKSKHTTSASICKKKLSRKNKHTINDSNDSPSSVVGSLPANLLNKNDDIDDQDTDSDSLVQKMHLPARTSAEANNTSDGVAFRKSPLTNNQTQLINSRENTKAIVNEIDLRTPVSTSFHTEVETVQNEQIFTDLFSQNTSSSDKSKCSSVSLPKKISSKCINKQQIDTKSCSATLIKETIGKTECNENLSNVEESPQVNTVKVNNKTDMQNLDKHTSSLNSLQKSAKSNSITLTKETNGKTECDENPPNAEESPQVNTMKVNSKTGAENVDKHTSSSSHSLQKAASRKNMVITEGSTSVLNHKKSPAKKSAEEIKHLFEPRITRNSLKKLNIM